MDFCISLQNFLLVHALLLFWPGLEIKRLVELVDFGFVTFWSGQKTIKGALAMPLMIEGYKKDLIKFAIITCRKPE